MRSYPMYIDGEDREGQSWKYTVRSSALIADPAGIFNLGRELDLGNRDPDDAGIPDGVVVGRCAIGGARESAEALESARRASREMSRMSIETRWAMGHDFGASVLAHAEEFVEILVAEGHPRRLAEWEVRGVIEGTCPETMDFYMAQLRTVYEQGPRTVILQRKADGVVCLNPPQNAAGSNSALGFATLLAGNALVVKAPRTIGGLSVNFLYREIVMPILERHGAPVGALNIIAGDSRAILRQWTQSPLVDDVMFFGDSVVGLKIAQDCALTHKKAILELSGNDALVVWKDADLDAASAALCECFYGSAQICMVPKTAVVHPDVADELFARLLARVAAIRPGMPEDPEVVLSPVLKADKYFASLAEAEQSGNATLLCGGRRLGVDGLPSEAGFFLEPSVVQVSGLTEARLLSCVRDETFFPVLPVIVPSAEEADDRLLDRVIDFLNANEYGLRNSLWAKDKAVIDAFVDGVTNAGILKVNESHIGFAPVLATHGGTGKTGGPYGELHYPILRTSHLQGTSMVPSGTYSAQDLENEVGLPADALDVG